MGWGVGVGGWGGRGMVAHGDQVVAMVECIVCCMDPLGMVNVCSSCMVPTDFCGVTSACQFMIRVLVNKNVVAHRERFVFLNQLQGGAHPFH